MANTLNVGSTKDFSGDTFSPTITLIDFTNLFAPATATFAGSQFDGTNISKSVAIDGSIQGNHIIVNNAAGIAFSAANWSFTSWLAADTITINGSGSTDKLVGSSNKDAINGGGGGDSIDGGDGDDTLDGGSGNDVIQGGAGADILNGGLDTDTLIYSSSNLAVSVNLATKTASGGHASGDTIGNFENLTGSAFNDTLVGNTGVNAISGGNGDDTITGGAGGDTLNGGSGTGDTVDYAASDAGVTVDLGLQAAAGGHADGDKISSFESAIGSAHADILLGTSGVNFLSGLDGDDTIDGGAGADSLDGGSNTDSLKLDRSAAVAGLTVNISAGGGGANIGDGTKLSGFERLEFKGGSGADKVTGGALNDVIDGGTGADNLNGGGGIDLLILDRNASALAFDVNVSNGTQRTLADGVKYSNFEQIAFTGGGGNDVVAGFDFDDVIKGGDGNDDLSAGSGVDFLDGGEGDDFLLVTGTGADTVIGGVGTDFLFLDRLGAATKLTVNISSGGGGAAIGDGSTLDGIESLGYVGGTLRDVVTGGGLADNLDGQAGNDTLGGGGGKDSLQGGAGDDALNGGAGDDIFSGGEGADTMNGGGGGDIFFIGAEGGADNIDGGGGVGLDTLSFNVKTLLTGMSIDISTGAGSIAETGAVFTGIERIAFAGGDGDDTITGGAFDDQIAGGTGGNTLSGGGGDDVLSGGSDDEAGNGVQNLSGGSGGDQLQSFGASGTLDGGDGDDFVVLNLAAANNQTVMDGGAGTDSLFIFASNVFFNFAVDLTLAGSSIIGSSISTKNFERASISSGNGNDSFRGGALDDLFSGGDGNDTAEGGQGADILTGGDGTDTLSYASSAQGVQVGLNNSAGVGGDAEGDSLGGFEILIGSNQDDTLSGDTQANIVEGRSGADLIFGGLGDDVLIGGAGADAMDAGGGADTASYLGSDAGVTVNLQANSASGGHAQGDTLTGFENLTGSGLADTLTGNTQVNILAGGVGNDTLNGGGGVDTLLGESGVDTLNGGGGADTLNGGANADALTGGIGKDTMTGGSGADRFIYTGLGETGLNGARDVITDFVAGSDKINLSAIDANAVGGTASDAFIFVAGVGTPFANGAPGQVRFEHLAGNTIVSLETTGDTAADAQIHLTGLINLAAGDFIL